MACLMGLHIGSWRRPLPSDRCEPPWPTLEPPDGELGAGIVLLFAQPCKSPHMLLTSMDIYSFSCSK